MDKVKLRSRRPYTCRRILPATARICAAALREQGHSQCEPCDETEARVWDRFMYGPLRMEPSTAQTQEEAAIIRAIWPQ
ncbi:MAG: hypothetical protein QME60_08435 [Verrucomicrobiota bacterium]|nr:hypothetical protein [Verrucomicrobiota bacterium]